MSFLCFFFLDFLHSSWTICIYHIFHFLITSCILFPVSSFPWIFSPRNVTMTTNDATCIKRSTYLRADIRRERGFFEWWNKLDSRKSKSTRRVARRQPSSVPSLTRNHRIRSAPSPLPSSRLFLTLRMLSPSLSFSFFNVRGIRRISWQSREKLAECFPALCFRKILVAIYMSRREAETSRSRNWARNLLLIKICKNISRKKSHMDVSPLFYFFARNVGPKTTRYKVADCAMLNFIGLFAK